MRLQFNFRKDASNPLGYTKVPGYSLPDWNLVSESESNFTYRPSAIAFLRRLLWTLLALLLMGLLIWDAGIPEWNANRNLNISKDQEFVPVNLQLNQQAKLNDRIIKQKWDEIQEKQKKAREAKKKKEAENKKFSPLEKKLWWSFTSVMIFMGTWPPLVCLWQRIRIARNHSDELEIFRLGSWPSTHRYPIENFNHIQIIVKEDIHRVRFRSYHEGWRWIVLLCHTDQPSLAINSFAVDNGIEFHVSQQSDKPFDLSRPPKQVRKFAKLLKKTTGIESVGFTMTEDGTPEYGLFQTSVPQKTVTYTQPKETRTVYESPDEMPEEIRKQYEEMKKEQEETGEPVVRKTTRIRIMDKDGNRQEFNSIEEMPPELQEKYKRALRKRNRE